MRQLSIDLEDYFIENGYHWGSGEEAYTPSPAQIDEALDLLKSRLYDEPEGTSITMGRFTVHKNAGVYDLYVHRGQV